ncbi:hypothetical protein BFU36_01760 [Sulfolobus sp. A20]|uniref:hypothetical protein n=1 Tax=Sulfolobaceae TaxID=118883 RepID=UPI000845ECED|nr:MULTISPECIES: hypothetical protein [unclassified Sulfolobus]TRM74868.1 hypothetical protein DJ523_03930 [Sulfolobus sp. E5]TRM78181.1 hypothetical protein DJ532_02170 [Sulfolobus sp. A20-N-F8]TRM79370.1 hypothetical protein DJ528_01420 [Sulfolobus sp. B5]TRM80850.1 hypothetical protein DJ524_06160 [Sulfolobus sp. D5]TRM84130.1 hypothetical protein DJ531_01800 [Sulfolobus sp. A20-N-F6]TRM84574.1 hypothetical protein DJ522_04215 [Sulfolobus sp. F3]TRM88844.1 hypothetical protein DJ529_04010
MKIDDILKVASDYPSGKLESQVIKLEDELLHLEQLPQILNLLDAKKVEWRYNATIVGPDLSIVNTEGGTNEKKLIVRTPINKVSIPWKFHRIEEKNFIKLINYLIPCKEGKSIFNPSPWERYYFNGNRKILLREGEIGEGLTSSNTQIDFRLEENNVKLETNFLNPYFYYINPYYLEKDEKPINQTFAISLELTESYSIISNSKLNLKFNLGEIKAESDKKIMIVKSKSTKEAKIHRLLWDMENEVIELDCKPPFPLSLYRLEPASVVPLHFSFSEKSNVLDIILENFEDKPVIATLYLSARISKVIEPLNISSEYDRIKIPIRRWGIAKISIEVKKLPEIFLKRKAI